jgi:hypothetical protein
MCRGTQICLIISCYQIGSFSSVVEREIADLQVARSNRAGSFSFAVRATDGVMGINNLMLFSTQKLFIIYSVQLLFRLPSIESATK